MPAPSLPWTDAMVADAAGRLRSDGSVDRVARFLERLGAAYGLRAGLRPAGPTLAHGFEGFLLDPAGAEPWTLPLRTLLADPEEHLPTLLRAIETARPA